MNSYTIDSNTLSKLCIIWMHGLGADAQDMMGLARELPLTIPTRHVFLDAPIRPVTLNGGMPMRAWYDIASLSERGEEDRKGILASGAEIEKVIKVQLDAGFSSQQILLAGFSQGGAMALFTGLEHDESLGGIIGLSTYLPLISAINLRQAHTIPLFLASGKFDPVVSPEWTRKSAAFLINQGYKAITEKVYPMEHAICGEEMNDLTQWIETNFSSRSDSGGLI